MICPNAILAPTACRHVGSPTPAAVMVMASMMMDLFSTATVVVAIYFLKLCYVAEGIPVYDLFMNLNNIPPTVTINGLDDFLSTSYAMRSD